MFTAPTREHRYVMSLICAALFLFLVTGSIPAGGSEVNKACSYNENELAGCALPLIVKLNVLPYYADLQLQHDCSEMAVAIRCMDTKVCAGNTSDRSTAFWYGMKDGMNFTCTREQEYNQHDACMSTNATRNALNFCTPSPPNTTQTELEKCIEVNSEFKCMWTTNTVRCGEETARFVHEFSKRVYQPILNTIHCVVEDVEGKQTSLASSLHQISFLWSAFILPFLSLVLAGCYKLN